MNNFEKLGLNSQIIQAITELGFENPTPVQEQAIPQLITHPKDFIGLAQTGTGKTAAFGLPLLQLIDVKSKITQALVLAPTRELCVQIANDVEKFSKYMGTIKTVAIYGGASISEQIRAVKRGAQIVVATPGRLIDMINRDVVDLSNVRYTVLDEADEMLNMGFKEEIDAILENTPETKNTWLFSATMPQEVRDIARNYMFEPVEITMGKKNSGAENIEHIYYVVQSRDRYSALKRLVDSHPEIFGIIFCRTKLETQDVAEKLVKDGYNADALHGDLSQAQRDKVMARYRQKTLQLLVATDVAARGIDVNDVTHVINYNLPDELENYTHRSGRTARAGKSGVSMIIIGPRDVSKIRQIEKVINKKFTNGKIPSGVVVVENQLLGLIKRIHNVEVNEQGIAKYLPAIFDELKDLSKEDLVKRMVSVEFNRFLEYYRNADDLNVDASRRSEGDSGFTSKQKLFINLGSVDGFDKTTMLNYLIEITGLSKTDFGHMNIKGVYSFIDMTEEKLGEALEKFKGEVYKGRKVRTDISASSGGRSSGSRSGSKYGGDRGRSKSYGSDRNDNRSRGDSYGKRNSGNDFGAKRNSNFNGKPRNAYSSKRETVNESYDDFFKSEFSDNKGFSKGDKKPRKKY